MAKKWQIAKKINEEIIKNNPDINPVVLQLLYNRGLQEKEDIKKFFEDNINNLHDPFLFKNMKAGVDLIIKHIKEQNKIVICGDYDADGVTASAILSETIKSLKGLVDVWIPSRFGDGYGLNKKTIKEIFDKGCRLLITVDNGIRSNEEINYAQELGIDCLLTDHHKGPAEKELYPKCLIINPILEEETYPFKFLCGAGVAFKVACALIETSTLEKNTKNNLKYNLLDLAAIGTIGDCVNLLGENRLIAKEGIKLINEKPRLGIKELIKVAQVNTKINEYTLGWQITPRLNVSGRLEHANTSYELLTTKKQEEAEILAAKLNEQNISRQKITQEIIDYCEKSIINNNQDDKIIILLSPSLEEKNEPDWLEGVIGLVAGRITEKYSKPTLVITLSEGNIKGSGRSLESFDITAMLEKTKEFYSRYGGHKMACGFTIKSKEALKDMIVACKKLAKENLKDKDLEPVLKIEAEVNIEEIDNDLVDSLEKFSPFGQDNPLINLLSCNCQIKDKLEMGLENQHVKLRLNGFWAISFNKAEEYKNLKIGDKIDLVYNLEYNIFNGYKNIQLKIIDLKLSE